MAQQPPPPQQQRPMPQAPIFGMAGGSDVPSNKFINIDEIFADCFMDTDPDLMGITGTGPTDLQQQQQLSGSD
eukprot:1530-Heterococcus_DN1.PRE.5